MRLPHKLLFRVAAFVAAVAIWRVNQVLKGVNLHIPGGTTCALVGRSGSGKTTLVHLLLRFYDPRVSVDGYVENEIVSRSQVSLIQDKRRRIHGE